MPDLKTRGELVLAWVHRLIGRLDGSHRGGRRGIILAYHRILPGERLADFPYLEDLVTGEAAFAAQMDLLARRFRVLPLEEMFDFLREDRPLPSGSVSVTFDDGYADNYTHALPILRRHRLPATVFLATGHVGGARGLFWWDEVSRWRAAGKWAIEVEGLGRRALRTLAERDALLGELKRLPVDDAVRRVRDASDRAGLEPSPEAGKEFLTWDQAREMGREGIELGAHTVSHCLLPRESPERRRREATESRAAIERETGRPCRFFCYPDGAVTDDVAAEIRSLGFAGAVATGARDVVQEPPLDLYRVPRKIINYRAGMTVFRFRLSGHPERIKRRIGRAPRAGGS